MKKICIFGAGAIGGYLACSLKNTNNKISIVARGQHKEIIEKKGLTLIKDQIKRSFHFDISEKASDLGKQDYIFIGVKAQSIPLILDNLSPILDENTTIISAVNGLPWWYFHEAKTQTKLDNTHLESVDPKGKIWKTLNPNSAIGCVVYPACEILEPGIIKHTEGDRFSLGEPNGMISERLKEISSILIDSGLKAPQKKNLRDEIWIKLWGNCSFNILSALTGSTLDEIGENPAILNLIKKMMEECKLVGEEIGIKFRVSINDRIKGATSIQGHKPSTAQDLEAGKPLEIDPIIGSIIEVGKKLNINTYNLEQMYNLLKFKGELLGIYEKNEELEKILH